MAPHAVLLGLRLPAIRLPGLECTHAVLRVSVLDALQARGAFLFDSVIVLRRRNGRTSWRLETRRAKRCHL